MADKTIHIFRVSDRKLLSSMSEVDKLFPFQNNRQVQIRLSENTPEINFPISEVDQKDFLTDILTAELPVIYNFRANLQNIRATSFNVQRKIDFDYDVLTISYPNDLPLQEISPLILEIYKHFQVFGRTDAIDKTLGKKLTEFYRCREEGLIRLETLSQKLIEQNESFRRKLDEEHTELKRKAHDELEMERAKLIDEIRKKEESLAEQEVNLEARIKDLDDRDSRHARRQIRMDLKNALAERARNFSLTKSTINKRIPNHVLFIILILIACIFSGTALYELIYPPKDIPLWYLMLRFSLSVAAFAAALIFYIRWNDHWFHQHADEEFMLKRLELDIDRASWVVEMAQEWKDEKGSEIPEFFIACLTRNLFCSNYNNQQVKHPSEDLASALIDATSDLNIKLPGLGEATLNKRGINKFRKTMAEQNLDN